MTSDDDDVSSDDVTISCTVSCQDGFTFSGAVLERYTCGPRTGYLWPHESPDNPRALLPPCTGNKTHLDSVASLLLQHVWRSRFIIVIVVIIIIIIMPRPVRAKALSDAFV